MFAKVNSCHPKTLPLRFFFIVRHDIRVARCLPGICSVFIMGGLLAFLFISDVQAQDTMRIGIHPYLSASELYERFTPLKEYLSRELGMNVDIEITSNYGDHIEKIGKDMIDIAYMGPAAYVMLVDEYGNKPLLAAIEINRRSTFHGVVIARRTDPINSLDDLRGKRFAFGDQNSTMSHLVPRYMLIEAGIGINDLRSHSHLSNHDNVALGVLMGNFDAGAVKLETYHEYRDHGLKMIAKSPDIQEHLFVARANLPPQTVRSIRSALLKLKDSEHGTIVMRAIKKNMTAMVEVRDSHYGKLRSILAILKAGEAEPLK